MVDGKLLIFCILMPNASKGFLGLAVLSGTKAY